MGLPAAWDYSRKKQRNPDVTHHDMIGMKFRPLLLLATALPAGAALHTEVKEASLRILDGDKLVTEYRTDSRTPYLYPLLSPAGATLSRHWPADESVAGEEHDHPHHRSFWLSHGAVDGFDFWSWTGTGDPKIEHRGFSAIHSDEHSATFTADLEWLAAGTSHLKEKRTYTFRQTDPETFEIEVATTLTPSSGKDVTFGDTKEGFFGLRVDRTLRLKGPQAKGHIALSTGLTDAACWGKRADWSAFYGPDESGEPAVIAMMDHPSNLRHPTWWHARDFGLLAANPFGIHNFESKADQPHLGDYVLKKDDRLSFRYLVVLHHGSLDSAKLADRWNAFSH